MINEEKDKRREENRLPGKNENEKAQKEDNERDYPSREPEGAPYIGDNPDEIRKRTPKTDED